MNLSREEIAAAFLVASLLFAGHAPALEKLRIPVALTSSTTALKF